MKAIVYENYGSPDVLEIKELEKPVPGDNEVLVNVHAVSINSWDQDLLRGVPFVNRLMAGVLKPRRITTLGCDIAGKVEAIGKSVKRFKPGDEVFGDLSSCGWGGFAEYVCARENALAHKPESISFEQAAALPQAGLLALQGLRDKGRIQAGQKVLINGAGGGAGTFAIQLARYFGADVTGVDSTNKLALMRSLGAHQVIDYTQQDFTRNGQQYDLILDISGTHSIFDVRRSLSTRGRYVMVGGSTTLVNQLLFLGPWLTIAGRKKMGLLMHKANRGLDDLMALVETGDVVPIIDKRYRLDEVAEAMRYFAAGSVKGKIVMSLDHGQEHSQNNSAA